MNILIIIFFCLVMFVICFEIRAVEFKKKGFAF